MRAVTRAVAAAAMLAAAAAGASGCAAAASAAPPIQLATAFVGLPKVPGTTVAYVTIRNNGAADRLIAARTSAGGRVTFRVPVTPGGAAMRPVPAVAIPGHATTQLAPDTGQLLITGAGPLRSGKAVTLTLVFANAGPVSVITQVINPESGGSSYFMN
jgi:periplasmic copper chaperone A